MKCTRSCRIGRSFSACSSSHQDQPPTDLLPQLACGHSLGVPIESEGDKTMRFGRHQLLALLLWLGHHRDQSELLPNTIQLLSGSSCTVSWQGSLSGLPQYRCHQRLCALPAAMRLGFQYHSITPLKMKSLLSILTLDLLISATLLKLKYITHL